MLWFLTDLACLCPVVFHLSQVHFYEDVAMLRPNAHYKQLLRLEAIMSSGRNPAPGDIWWAPGGLVFGTTLVACAAYIVVACLYQPYRLIYVSACISICLAYSHGKNKLY